MEADQEAYSAAGAPCWQSGDMRPWGLPRGEKLPFLTEPSRLSRELKQKTLIIEVHSGQARRMSVCLVTDTNRNRKAGK